MIKCQSIYENWVELPVEKLAFRPSVYAVVLNEGKVLLMINHSSGKYTFPGGGVEIGETLEHALRREMREETGLEVEIGALVHVQEHFFYYDPGDLAFHSFMFYYRCRIQQTEITPQQTEFDESEHPQWVALTGLKREQVQSSNQPVFDLLQNRLDSHKN
jgi:nucleoside triphosphatase